MSSPVRDTFSALRLGVGVASWCVPDRTARAFALTSDPFVLRLFGARETAMGLGLRVSSPDLRRTVIRAGIAIDVIDAVGGLLDRARGRLRPGRATVLGPGGALFFAALGVGALREHDRQW